MTPEEKNRHERMAGIIGGNFENLKSHLRDLIYDGPLTPGIFPVLSHLADICKDIGKEQESATSANAKESAEEWKKLGGDLEAFVIQRYGSKPYYEG